MKRLIHHNKKGLIPRIHSWFNIQKTINIIHYNNRRKMKNHMISIDRENNFEKHLTSIL